jgi:hypothetical protein
LTQKGLLCQWWWWWLYIYRKRSPQGSVAVSKVSYGYQCVWGLRSSRTWRSVDLVISFRRFGVACPSLPPSKFKQSSCFTLEDDPYRLFRNVDN